MVNRKAERRQGSLKKGQPDTAAQEKLQQKLPDGLCLPKQPVGLASAWEEPEHLRPKAGTAMYVFRSRVLVSLSFLFHMVQGHFTFSKLRLDCYIEIVINLKEYMGYVVLRTWMCLPKLYSRKQDAWLKLSLL